MDRNWLKQRGLLERPQVWLVADFHQDLLMILDGLSHDELSDWDVDMILDWREVLDKSHLSPCDVIVLSLQSEDPFPLLDAVRADPSPDSPLGGVPVLVLVSPGQEESLAARALRRGAWDYGLLGQMTPFALRHRVALALQYQYLSLCLLHGNKATSASPSSRGGLGSPPTLTSASSPVRHTDPQETHPQETHPQEADPQETHPQETHPQETHPQEADPEVIPWLVNDFAPLQAETIAQLTAENRYWRRTLRQQEATYYYLFEHHPQPLWVFDLQTLGFLAVNAAAIAKYGYSEAEFLSMTVADIHDPADVPQLLNYLAQEEDGLTLVGIRQHQCKNGQFMLVEIASHSVEFRGRSARLTWVNDVTARTLAEQELIQLNQSLEQKVTLRAAELLDQEIKLQSILDFAPELIFIKDFEDRHVLVNQAFVNRFNTTCAEVTGKRTDELFPPDIANRLQSNDQQLLATGGVQQFEETVQINGTEHVFWVSKFLLKDYQGRLTGICGIATEITERKQAEMKLGQVNRELIRATQLKDEFLASMSHELRTPLNAILGMTEALQEQVFGYLEPRQLDALNGIERSGTHLLDLINDILDIAKIEAGQEVLNLRVVAIAALCESSLAFVKPQALRKCIDLGLTIDPTLASMRVDERRIRQVLINLLTNAVKFTDDRGRVSLAVRPVPIPDPDLAELQPDPAAGQGIQFEVTDTGIGIRAEDCQRVFQPFVQVDGSLSRQYEGTGLGLALVKHLVELHGGTVTVESEVGVGSCFRVTLPVELSGASPAELPPDQFPPSELPPAELPPDGLPPAALPLDGLPSQDTPLSRAAPTPAVVASDLPIARPIPGLPTPCRILVVEDNDANLMSVVDYLMAKGYEVWTAGNGEAAIARLETQVPDCILMDVQMPILDGIETTRRLRQDPRLDSVPILILTAMVMPGDRDRCLAIGANDYLTKPIPLKQLHQTIQDWLHRPQSSLGGG